MSIVDVSEMVLELGLTGTEEERAIIQSAITASEGAVKRFLKYDPVYGERTEYYPNMDVTKTGRTYIWQVNNTQAFLRQLSDISSTELQISHLPLRSIIDLRIDYDGRFGTRPGSFPETSKKQEGVDYWPTYDGVDSEGNKVCRDGIVKSIGVWPLVSGCIKIVYTSGYKEAELRGTDPVINAHPILETVKDEVTRRVAKIFTNRKSRASGTWGALTSENLGSYSYSRDPQALQRLIGGTDLSGTSRERLAEYENLGASLMS